MSDQECVNAANLGGLNVIDDDDDGETVSRRPCQLSTPLIISHTSFGAPLKALDSL